MLSPLFANSLQLDSKIRASERDAKVDIYNYAARFDCVPNFEVRLIRGPIEGSKKKVIEVTVELVEQNIRVVAIGRDPSSAEISAALKFKTQAERYHAQGDKGSIVIKDFGALTTANSRGFLDLYQIINPHARVAIDCETIQDASKNTCYKAQLKIDNTPVGYPVEMRSRKGAEDLAYLTAAIALKKEQPHLYPRFLQALKTGNGNILKPLQPTPMRINTDTAHLMREMILGARDRRLLDNLPDETDQPIVEEAISGISGPRYFFPVSQQADEQRDSQMQNAHRAYLQDIGLHELRWKRSELPMNQYRAEVLNLINNHQYSIIVGATGSGKTTQVPQILLEEAIVKGSASACNIICTQPRRIAATSVARRVAEERAERLQQTVGYQVRFDAKLPWNRGSISYCTTGILLKQLQHSPDDIMDGISHLIIDEIHERGMEVDFLLVILKRLVKERTMKGRSSPKIVLMSATIDTDLFAAYFSSGTTSAVCPSLTVPGRTFPVQEKYLDSILNELTRSYPLSSLLLLQTDDPTNQYLTMYNKLYRNQSTIDPVTTNDSVIDWKKERKLSAEGEIITEEEKDDALVPNALVATTIAHIAKTNDQGAILAFLPGLDEIVKVGKWLTGAYTRAPTGAQLLGVDFRDTSKFKIYMLHSSIAAGQAEVFETLPPGCRKIILATNIAETSITIPDVQHVVDTGKARQKQYDQIQRITNFKCTWISKSNSKQRAGRAGRVQNGNYYALFPKQRYELMRASPLAEMHRSDLQETCLAIKAHSFNVPIREFLAESFQPPSPKAVDASVISLEALDALTSDEKLTPLGRLLATLPVHPSLGKMMVLGVIFRCLDPVMIIGAAASERSLFVQPLGKRREAQAAKQRFAGSSGSDHIAVLNAVREMRHHSRSNERFMHAFANDNFIHLGAFRSIKSTVEQIVGILANACLIPSTALSGSRHLEFGHPSLNQNSANISLIKAIILTGLHPNLAVTTSASCRFFRTPSENSVMMHMSSVNSHKQQNNMSSGHTLFSYSSLVRSADGGPMMMIRDTTQCTPLMAVLFGGKIINTSSNVLEMDGWLPWWVRDGTTTDRSTTRVIVEFREELDRVLCRAFQDLSNTKAPEDNRQSLLKFASIFADGVVEVLDRDGQSDPARSGSTAQGPVRPPGSVRRRTPQTGDRYGDHPRDNRETARRRVGYNQRDDYNMEDNYDTEKEDVLQDEYDVPARYRPRHSYNGGETGSLMQAIDLGLNSLKRY